jgi:hypothetical protein
MPRTLKLELSSSEVELLSEVMCERGCSMEDAVRWLIVHRAPRDNRSAYMRKYMRDYRNAQRQGRSG